MRHLFRVLPILAIIFQAGISGAWFAGQFAAPLPPAWGWFGAGIIGVTMWAGIELAVDGQRLGWPIALVAGAADVVMASAYFGAEHPPLLTWSLALAPAGITVLVGLQASMHEAAVRADAAKHREAEDRHRRRLETMRAKAELAADMTGHDRTVSNGAGHGQDVDRMTLDMRRAWLDSNPGAYDVSELARAWGVSGRTIRRDLTAIGYHKNGDGRWHKE
jgi:hypothetical protein